jgi:hypothetical protein
MVTHSIEREGTKFTATGQQESGKSTFSVRLTAQGRGTCFNEAKDGAVLLIDPGMVPEVVACLLDAAADLHDGNGHGVPATLCRRAARAVRAFLL